MGEFLNFVFLCCHSDGRQSAIVTKVFIVACIPADPEEPSDNNQEYSIKSLEQSHGDHVCISLNLPHILTTDYFVVSDIISYKGDVFNMVLF